MMDIKGGLLLWFTNFLIKSSGSGVNMHANNKRHLDLYAINKQVLWICNCTSFGYAIKSKFNKGFRFLLRVTDIFSKYAWVFPLKDKKMNYNY